MPSFDISSTLDIQKVDNAVNTTRKEFLNRWDFKNSQSQIELNKKNAQIQIETENEMRLNTIIDLLYGRMMKQGLDPRGLDASKPIEHSGAQIRKTLLLKQGLEADNIKRILQCIKALNVKVTAQKMDDLIRVSHKQIDTLQLVMQACLKSDCSQPLQFTNLKSS